MAELAAVQAEGLAKRFGDTQALCGVDLELATGTVLGVLGPNGAGKTTAVRILATLTQPDAGRAFVAGHDVVADPVRVRSLIGFTGQFAAVDDDLGGRENLMIIGRLLGLRRAAARARATELLDAFGLTDVAHRPAHTYSGGMRRRLDLAASLVGRPEVLYLDEPTTGLDPHARRQLWQLARGLLAEGVSILLTTQYLDEADQLADRVTVLDQGRVVADGRPDELKRRIGGHTVTLRPAAPHELDTASRELSEITGVVPRIDRNLAELSAPLPDPAMLSELVRRLDNAGVALAELAVRLPSLDEVFLALTRNPGESLGSRT